MSNRQVETSRELRLWIGQVIIPGIIIATVIYPKYKDDISRCSEKIKRKIENRKRFFSVVNNRDEKAE